MRGKVPTKWRLEGSLQKMDGDDSHTQSMLSAPSPLQGESPWVLQVSRAWPPRPWKSLLGSYFPMASLLLASQPCYKQKASNLFQKKRGLSHWRPTALGPYNLETRAKLFAPKVPRFQQTAWECRIRRQQQYPDYLEGNCKALSWGLKSHENEAPRFHGLGLDHTCQKKSRSGFSCTSYKL